MAQPFTISATELTIKNLGVFLKDNPSREEIVGAVINVIKPQLNQVKEGEEFTVKLVHGEKTRVIRFKREVDSSDYQSGGSGFGSQVFNANIICLDTGGTQIKFPQYQTSPPRPFLAGPAEAVSAFKNKISGFFSGIQRAKEEAKSKWNKPFGDFED